jgi:superfamily I DNA/RNA helicase
VRVLTLHAAKGLEFPIVIVAGLESGSWPVPEDFEEPDLFAERARHERRKLSLRRPHPRHARLMLLSPRAAATPPSRTSILTHWHVESAV